MNETKKILLLGLVLVLASFGAGYVMGGYWESRAADQRIGELRDTINGFRGGIDKLQEENRVLAGLLRANQETINASLGLVSETRGSLENGISTVSQAIGLVRSIKQRLIEVEKVLRGQNGGNVDTRGPGSSDGPSWVPSWEGDKVAP